MTKAETATRLYFPMTYCVYQRFTQLPINDKTFFSNQNSLYNLEARADDLCEQVVTLSTVTILALPAFPPGPTQISDREWSWNAHGSEQLDSDQVPPKHGYSEPGSSGTLTNKSLVNKRTSQRLVEITPRFGGEKTYDDEAASCNYGSFSDTPPCSCGEYEPKACAEENEHENDVHPCRTDHE